MKEMSICADKKTSKWRTLSSVRVLLVNRKQINQVAIKRPSEATRRAALSLLPTSVIVKQTPKLDG